MDWTAHVTALTLNRLGEREIATMIDRVAGNKALPANIRQDIIERTDGIPLFVEEMTKAVLEAENEGAAQRAVPLFRRHQWPSLQACTLRSWRGLIGSVRPRRWHRSER